MGFYRWFPQSSDRCLFQRKAGGDLSPTEEKIREDEDGHSVPGQWALEAARSWKQLERASPRHLSGRWISYDLTCIFWPLDLWEDSLMTGTRCDWAVSAGWGAVVTRADRHEEAAGKSVVSFLLWFTVVTKWSYVMCSCPSFCLTGDHQGQLCARPAPGTPKPVWEWGYFSLCEASLPHSLDRQTDRQIENRSCWESS